MNAGDLNKVWEIKALKKPGQDEAKKLLEKIAIQVQPIMRRHKWRVKVLSEFCPNNPRLLGLNVGGGVHVKVRLRRPNRDWEFFPFNQVLDTMLHELCHNAHGPHNASFYKLWDELRKECEELMAKGVTGTGQGFDLPGRRVGGFAHQPPLPSLRQTALAAAEKRARLASLLPSGPKRLGGDGAIMAALTPVQAAAMAAERRLQDEIWCGSQSIKNSDDDDSNLPPPNGASRKRSLASDAHPSVNSFDVLSNSNFIDLSADALTPGSISVTDARCAKRSCQSKPNLHSQSAHASGISSVDFSGPSSSRSVLNVGATNNSEELEMWECTTCTLLNRPLAPVCEVCGSQKPKDVTVKYRFWTCEFCTLENCVRLDRCSACDQWRYSRGGPSATYAPNLGT